MNKEEKIYIDNMVKVLQILIDKYDTPENHGGYPKEGYEYVKNLLQSISNLPQRTIETLEIGDYVEFELYGVHEIIKGFVKADLIDDFVISGVCYPKEHIELTSKPIPHEALDLLKEVLK